MTPFRILVIAGTLMLSAPVGPAQSQSPQPYGLKTYGAFQQMAMQRDYSAKVTLDAAFATGATDGLGALSGGRGEVTIIDGKPIVSYGTETAPPAQAKESAMMLQTVEVHDWQQVAVTRDVAPGEIEAFLAEQAKTHGIDPGKPFVFRLRGTLAPYTMHVISGPGPGHPPLKQETRTGDAISGLVVGLHVTPELVGIVSHPGERLHSHWISDDRTKTEHLDAWGIKSGAVLLLPKP